MINIKRIYPSEEGDVVEIISLEDAVQNQLEIAFKRGHCYATNQDIIDDILCCPCTEMTNEAVGKTVTPYKEKT